MKSLKADLHIHTCLSPCAEPEMVPTKIVKCARGKGLDVIAICDHNSAENVSAVMGAGERHSLCVIPGIEVTSREEVHLIGLFPSVDKALRMQDLVYQNLEERESYQDLADQTVVNEEDRPVRQISKLLIGATRLGIDQVVEAIHCLGGLAVASHVDRESYGLVGHLGFIPKGLALDALEISPRGSRSVCGDFPVLRSSDSHRLEEIGRGFSVFHVREENLSEIAKALRGEEGRWVEVGMEDISLHVLDIVENSVAASATSVEILLEEDSKRNLLTLEVRDNGKGMDQETKRKALDPFFTTKKTRKVGLGLPLLAQAARESGGEFELDSEPGKGTTVRATFKLDHPDCKPLGDFVSTLETILTSKPGLELRFEYRKDSKKVAEFHNRSEDQGA